MFILFFIRISAFTKQPILKFALRIILVHGSPCNISFITIELFFQLRKRRLRCSKQKTKKCIQYNRLLQQKCSVPKLVCIYLPQIVRRIKQPCVNILLLLKLRLPESRKIFSLLRKCIFQLVYNFQTKRMLLMSYSAKNLPPRLHRIDKSYVNTKIFNRFVDTFEKIIFKTVIKLKFLSVLYESKCCCYIVNI